MIDWLGDSARTALQKAHGGLAEGYHHYGLPVDLSTAAPAHVHCVAAVLWNSQEKHVGYNLFDLVSMDLLRFVIFGHYHLYNINYFCSITILTDKLFHANANFNSTVIYIPFYVIKCYKKKYSQIVLVA